MTTTGYRSVLIPADMSPDQVEIMMQFVEGVWEERKRAHAKHGTTSMEQSELLAHRRASILVEEACETSKALNDNEHAPAAKRMLPTIDRIVWRPGCDPLDREVVQTGAMAYAWFANRRGDRLAPVRPETVVTRTASVRLNYQDGGADYVVNAQFAQREDGSWANVDPIVIPRAVRRSEDGAQ